MNNKAFFRKKTPAEIARKKQANEAKEAADREFKRNVGPETLRIIAIRYAITFVACIIFEICLGGIMWSAHNDAKPKSAQMPFDKAIKNAYNVTNLVRADKWHRRPHDKMPDAAETLIAMLGIGAAGLAAGAKKRLDKVIAKNTLQILQDETNPESYSNHLTLDRLLEMSEKPLGRSRGTNTWQLHPVCRPIVTHISAQTPRLFNNLITGTTKNPTPDYAIAVMEGHLQSHPEDLQKAIEAFKAHVLPDEVKDEYFDYMR